MMKQTFMRALKLADTALERASDVLWRQVEMVHDVLMLANGVTVAVWVVATANVGTGMVLLFGHSALFGAPATAAEIASPLLRFAWNFATAHVDLALLMLGAAAWLHRKPGGERVLWRAASWSSGVWGAFFVFAWLAVGRHNTEVVPTHVNAMIPLALGAFICLRLSAAGFGPARNYAGRALVR